MWLASSLVPKRSPTFYCLQYRKAHTAYKESWVGLENKASQGELVVFIMSQYVPLSKLHIETFPPFNHLCSVPAENCCLVRLINAYSTPLLGTMRSKFSYLAELCRPHDIPVELVQLVHPSSDSSGGKAN